ncbi:citrate/2-methylcitrate synthase [Leifsonia sp. F6_8S_P_1B]|uniref:citrate synthase (unknown stereospecificity) n=1 Tax=Leifsonia williamsii TaxID=3035919 RepID=A0ABT8KDY8_9MICO|nr:citrate/2-methylcitrate synthase [Leifsonia williamsii]MDN4615678.1 citrate/2-methylcitrate synthase [Leifsonia williamsii]
MKADARATDGLPRLTADQTAERLGVKLETLYAYVARGRLQRVRTAEGSLFDPLEVEAFAASRRRRAAPPTHAEGSPLMVIDTSFAHIEDGELWYRERPAPELARAGFETVARWALTGRWEESAGFSPGAGVDVARRVAEALPASAGDRDRVAVAVVALAAADPLRTSLDRAVVASAVERLVAGMVEVLPTRGAGAPSAGEPGAPSTNEHDAGTLAHRLWPRLTATAPTPEAVAVLDAALVLLIDHDIAVSTLAARAAASARATPYAVVSAGLGALDSPLHGNASRAAHRMLARVLGGEEPARVVAGTVLSTAGPVPGFGQPLYPEGDPRATVLLALLAAVPQAAPVLEAVEVLSGILHERTSARPNVDLALGALSLAAGMPDDAGEVVFAIARTVGWTVHALDEYAQPPLRLRPRGRYAPTLAPPA